MIYGSPPGAFANELSGVISGQIAVIKFIEAIETAK
jgi:hypothetical protein